MKAALLLVVALAAGVGLGLVYSWVISPVQIVDTSPDALHAAAQSDYVLWVARAYATDGDLGRARTRLALLGWTQPADTVTALAQRLAAEGRPEGQVRSVAQLAAALGAGPATTTPVAGTSPADTQVAVVTPGATATDAFPPSPTSSPTPQPTNTVIATITPQLLPTRTPTATPPGAFDFIGRQAVCDPDLVDPLIQVVAETATGEPVPGVEVVVTWDGGFDHFYTGLKPELGRGYGDFTMTPGIDYTLHLAESPSITIGGLTVESCGAGLDTYPGSWLLVFRHPSS